MIQSLNIFKNTKAEIFIHKVRRTKIILAKMKKLNIPLCYLAFKNSKVLCLLSNKSRFFIPVRYQGRRISRISW